VPGYTAELLMGLKKGKTLADYAVQLKCGKSDSSVLGAMKVAAGGVQFLKALCEAWFNEINSRDNTWSFLCDAGLCGSGPPRGVILRFVLELIDVYYAHEHGNALLHLVQKLQQKLASDDAGFQGNLLELETILLCKQGILPPAVLLTLEEQKWSRGDIRTFMEGAPTVWEYDEESRMLSGGIHGAGWHVVELPTGFCVFDLLLVCVRGGGGGGGGGGLEAELFGVQITISKTPFSQHASQETCKAGAKARLDALQAAVQKKFTTEKHVTYVMYAPKAIATTAGAPVGHLVPYYFSPPEKTGTEDLKKRQSRKEAPVAGKKTKK